jgi:hypothetical protein
VSTKKPNDDFVVEHGIPMPPKGTQRLPFSGMAVGDSFLVPANFAINEIYGAAQRHGMKVAQRKLDDGRRRVWRIE